MAFLEGAVLPFDFGSNAHVGLLTFLRAHWPFHLNQSLWLYLLMLSMLDALFCKNQPFV
jgi:hypothetical protein